MLNGMDSWVSGQLIYCSRVADSWCTPVLYGCRRLSYTVSDPVCRRVDVSEDCSLDAILTRMTNEKVVSERSMIDEMYT